MGDVGHVLERPASADEEKSWWGKRTEADVGEKEDTDFNGRIINSLDEDKTWLKWQDKPFGSTFASRTMSTALQW